MRKSILIIDNLQLSINAMSSVLTDWGYEVDGFLDPVEALSALVEKQYYMVFSELKMPSLDGYKLLYRFNKEKPEQKCCLVTGALDEEELLKKTIRLPNVKGLIKKPIKIKDLHIALEGKNQKSL
ncbi:MAG: response regulator [Litorilituus sp.]|jgi:DNA-binding NtrC family response regulator|nr:response regulator [Litorilituus sp.]